MGDDRLNLDGPGPAGSRPDPTYEQLQSVAIDAVSKLKEALGPNSRVILTLAIEKGDNLAAITTTNGPATSIIGLLRYTTIFVEKAKLQGIV